MDMNKEIHTFIKVWATIFISLSLCHFLGKLTPKGPPRLLFVAPIIFLFLLLPLTLQSVHLCGMTSFFIAWLANFKLLLFAFGRGPLSSASIPLHHFVTIACMPLKVSPNSSSSGRSQEKSFLNYVTKCVIYVSLAWVYDQVDHLHPKVIMFVYFIHMYCFLEICLTVFGVLARLTIGSDLEPPFNEPYLATSLQDFWGKRWNVTVTSILRPAVYEPTFEVLEPVLGPKWARIVAVWATFAVSAFMHELMFYYLGRQRPTWEISCLFLLHGTCLVAEVYIKRVAEKCNVHWRLPRMASNVATVWFLLATGFWLFFPQLIRCGVDVRGIEEYVAAGTWTRGMLRKMFLI